jgi:predicted molibdopterin-dependent oxidoreductase YjgC
MLSSTLDLSDAPEILSLMIENDASSDRFPGSHPRAPELVDDNPMFVRDYAKCLLCWRCVQVCADDAQQAFALSFDGRGYDTQIGTFFDRSIPETTCVLCGQCVGVCPTGALKPRREHLLESGKSPSEIATMSSGRKQRRGPRKTDSA